MLSSIGGKIIGFQHYHLISSQMLKNSMKILVLYPGFHFLVENHIKLSFLWNTENSACRPCVMLLWKREIPDSVYRDRQLVCSALARAGQPTLKYNRMRNACGNQNDLLSKISAHSMSSARPSKYSMQFD